MMNYSKPTILTAFALAFGIQCSLAENKPNIVLFLVDDMGLMDTSVPFLTDGEGKPLKHELNQFYRTPNMEKLASQGLRFSQFYANSVCSPTRVSIMTGQSSARHRTTQWICPGFKNTGGKGPKDWKWEGLGSESVTLARSLKENGYRTIHAGKGHFGPWKHEGHEPTKIGFDVNIGGSAVGQPGSYFGKENFGNRRPEAKSVPNMKAYHGKDIYLTDALALEVNKSISEAVEAKQPFFAYMSYYALHAPFMAHPKYVGNYNKESNKLNNFASMVEGMDDSVGVILSHLEKLGVAENTLVIFLGDNGSDAPITARGGYHSSAPLRGKKATCYEGGMRVPFIATWAKPSEKEEIQQKFPIAPGIIHEEFASIHDIWPTLMEVSGSKTPEQHTLDGYSLWGYFGQSRKGNPQRFLMHYPHPHRSSYFTAYRSGDWKLIRQYTPAEKPNRHQLYNLKQDPYEENNLAGAEPEELKKMNEAMDRELKAANALMPYPSMTP